MKPVIIIAIAFVLLIPLSIFAQESETCEDFDVETFTFGKYRAIEDYPLISALVYQGLAERTPESGEILVDYNENAQYDKECQALYKEYKQLGEKSKKWINSCTDLGEFPKDDQVREMYYVVNGVCRYASLTVEIQEIRAAEKSAKQPEPEITQEKYFVTPLPIVCGKGTILIDHICQVDKIEEKEKEIPIEKTIDIPEEKPSKKSVNWFSSFFDWLGGLFQ